MMGLYGIPMGFNYNMLMQQAMARVALFQAICNSYRPAYTNPFSGAFVGRTNYSDFYRLITNPLSAEQVAKFKSQQKFLTTTTTRSNDQQGYKANYTSNLSNNETSSYDITYKKSSKIKPGLLKGNLKGKEEVITRLCQKYNVDVALVVSIIGQESGFGTSNLARHNNFMGYRAAGDLGANAKGFGYFSTPEKGLEKAIANLAKYPQRYATVKKADMNNIDSIGRIYCEGTTYSSAVKNLYNTTVKNYLA